MPSSRASVPAFLNKLCSLLDDPSQTALHWADDGNSFIVHDQEEFAVRVAPNWFKHSKFSSFVRQLNMYGFRKVGPSTGRAHSSDLLAYAHTSFRRGQPELLIHIPRKSQGSPYSTGSTHLPPAAQAPVVQVYTVPAIPAIPAIPWVEESALLETQDMETEEELADPISMTTQLDSHPQNIHNQYVSHQLSFGANLQPPPPPPAIPDSIFWGPTPMSYSFSPLLLAPLPFLSNGEAEYFGLGYSVPPTLPLPSGSMVDGAGGQSYQPYPFSLDEKI